MPRARLGALRISVSSSPHLVAIAVLRRLYLRSSKERAFVRTVMGGQEMVLNGEAFALPMADHVQPVNTDNLRLGRVR